MLHDRLASRCVPSTIRATSPLYAETAKSLLKAKLKRRNVGYRELAERLTAMGTPESEKNIANKSAGADLRRHSSCSTLPQSEPKN
jgi:hypothetical protein